MVLISQDFSAKESRLGIIHHLSATLEKIKDLGNTYIDRNSLI